VDSLFTAILRAAKDNKELEIRGYKFVLQRVTHLALGLDMLRHELDTCVRVHRVPPYPGGGFAEDLLVFYYFLLDTLL